MAVRPKLLPAHLRARLIRELDQEVVVAVRRTRDPRGVVDAVVAALKHFWQREGLSVRGLGDLEDLAVALTERLERHHAMRGLGPPGAALRFDGAWLLTQVDALAGLRWEGHEPAPEPEPAATPAAPAGIDPRVAAADPADVRAYRPADSYAEGEIVRHAKFGAGRVARVIDATRIEVAFADGTRTLAQRLGA